MKKQKTKYRLRNWSEYNKSLERRGSLTVWVSEDVRAGWLSQEGTGERGHPRLYSDVAIECMAKLQAVYRLKLRQAHGMTESIFGLMNIELPVPHFSTLSRRKRKLVVELPQIRRGEGVHVVIDSTGVKVCGEGEWKVRQHGWSKRRTWKKLHLAVDESNGEILAAEVTDNSATDASVLPDLLDQVESPVKQVTGDKAYDKRGCYDAIRKNEARAVIPPQKGAHIWQHGNTKGERHDRDENLRAIRKTGKAAWKKASSYHRRSLAETTMSRLKRVFDPSISAKTFAGQTTEIMIRCKALNEMYDLGRPDSYRVG